MADEAYRAVFLRVHPTGKMVLSLTTDADGNDPGTPSSSPRSSGCRRSTSRSSRPTPTASAWGTATTPPSAGAPAAIGRATAKIRDKARLLAGMALGAPPESLLVDGAWVSGDGADPTQVKTIEDIAMYAHGTGALPPGVEGGLDAQSVYTD